MDTDLRINSASMHLHAAILLYGSGDHVEYATRHSVKAGLNGAPVILPGESLTQDGLADAYSGLLGKTGLQMLDRKILAYNLYTLVFWSPPKVRRTLFECPEPMGSKSGNVPHPGLVFVWQQSALSVFAVKGHRKPSLNTQLFHAPYMNIYAAGNMCLGNIHLPTPEPYNVPACEAAFFDSYFTHANNSKQVEYPGGIYAFWIDRLKENDTVFPEHVLIPTSPARGEKKFTVADLLSNPGG